MKTTRFGRALRPASPRGFTLIELLTVIAIIGILAAIIIPVTSSVRKSARNARCISNLRVLHTAASLYAGDNKGRLPVNDPSNDGNHGNQWAVGGGTNTKSALGLLLAQGYFSARTTSTTQSTFQNFWFCPTATYSGNEFPETSVINTQNSAYQYRFGGSHEGGGAPRARIQDVAQKALFADGFHTRFVSHDEKGRNAVYGDGHVRMVKFNDAYTVANKSSSGAYVSNLPFWEEWFDAARNGDNG